MANVVEVGSNNLGNLPPLGKQADDAARGAGQANNTVVEVDPGEGGRGDGQVADIGEQLLVARASFAGEHVC